MKQATGYSIWLMPEDLLIHELFSIIVDLSHEFGTCVFKPHVTLLSGIHNENDALLKTEKLASLVKAFYIELGNTRYSSKYFKKLFININNCEGLCCAREKAEALFNDVTNYKPHLSLVYGDHSSLVSGELNKKRMAWSLNRLRNKFQGVTIPITKLHLYKTTGYVWEWKEIAIFQL